MVEQYLHGEFGTAEAVGPYRASILYAVDRYAAAQKIHGWLTAGSVVISNRYVASNMAHQGGKIKDAAERQRFFAWNHELEYTIFQIPQPDLNLILHVPATVAHALVDKKSDREYLKGKKRDIHEDDLRHLADAERAYLELARTYPEFCIIECAAEEKIFSPETIHTMIWENLQALLTPSQ